MTTILVLGLILTIGPILGFMLTGTAFLYAALKEDNAVGIIGGLVTAAGIGAAFLGLWAYFTYIA